MLSNNDLLRSEQLTQQYRQHMYLKTEELKVQLITLIEGAKSELSSGISLLRDFMNQEAKSLHQLLQETNSNFLEHLTEEIRRRNHDKSDIYVKIQKVEESVQDCIKMRNINEESLNSLGQVAKNILEILHLDSVLDAQDEEDRKGISLWGFEDKNNSNKSKSGVISVDPNCISCTTHTSVVLSAFKMACLAYYPSKIEYKGCVCNRIDLFNKKIKKIEELEVSINEKLPWKSGKI